VTRNIPIFAARHPLIHEIAYHFSRNFTSSRNTMTVAN